MAGPRSIAVVTLGLILGACGSRSPSAPAAPNPALTGVAGLWRGALGPAECTGDQWVCGERGPDAFALQLTPDGAGVLAIDISQLQSCPWDPVPVSVDVTARVEDGTTRITGRSARLDVELDLTDTAQLQGTFRYAANVPTNLTDPAPCATVTKQGQILSASRTATISPGTFAGRWRGWIARTQCSGNCEDADDVLKTGAVELEISQAGGHVSGSFNGWEFAGDVAGGKLTATSRYREMVPTNPCHQQFDSNQVCVLDMNLSASADSLGRLHGTLTYHVEGAAYPGNRQYSEDASADLTGLVRWP
jgi:hypothetical protein